MYFLSGQMLTFFMVAINKSHCISKNIVFRILAISNAKMRYVSMGTANQYNTEDQKDASIFRNESAGIIER